MRSPRPWTGRTGFVATRHSCRHSTQQPVSSCDPPRLTRRYVCQAVDSSGLTSPQTRSHGPALRHALL